MESEAMAVLQIRGNNTSKPESTAGKTPSGISSSEAVDAGGLAASQRV